MTEALCGQHTSPGLDQLGAGVFLRQLRFLSPALASELGHVAVPVDIRGRNTNRDEDWYHEARCALLGWSWFTTDPGEIVEAIAFTAHVGGRAFLINGEKELRSKPKTAAIIAAHARRECDKHGIALGLVSFARPSIVRSFPWAEFAAVCDFGMPEVYDRRAAFEPSYPRDAIEDYRRAGFARVLPACGAYQTREGGGWRWRTPEELARHLALFPAGGSRTAWTLGGSKIPARVIRALVAHA